MDFALIIDLTIKAFLGLDAVYYIVAALGMNVQFGYTGLLNFGQAAFMAAGAYGLGMSVSYFGYSWWLGLVIGGIYAAVLALIVGVPTLRLRADYLAIVTIAMAEMVRLIVRSVTHKDKFGGTDGLKGFADGFQDLNPFDQGTVYGIGPFQASSSAVTVVLLLAYGALSFGIGFAIAKRRKASNALPVTLIAGSIAFGITLFMTSRAKYLGSELWVLLVGWVLVGVFSLFVYMLMRSPWGRVVKGIREDEEAVRSLGKNVFGYKMSALIIGAVLGMFSGVLFALKNSNVQPDNYSRAVTFYILTALVLGGLATVTGSVVGPMLFWALLAFTDVFLSELSDAQGRVEIWGIELLKDSSARGQFRLGLVGIGLILLMVFRPQGIFGNRKEMALDGR
jgi:neutral amino acid transport system permease protein